MCCFHHFDIALYLLSLASYYWYWYNGTGEMTIAARAVVFATSDSIVIGKHANFRALLVSKNQALSLVCDIRSHSNSDGRIELLFGLIRRALHDKNFRGDQNNINTRFFVKAF